MASSTHGGSRPGAGRPSNDRTVNLAVRISPSAMDKLNSITTNKSEFLDNLIKTL
ncbi:MAG: hypothetical protein MJZ41_06360 [Bacteroidaceae bacterium]|nr:hypothetical protein [Bacteroidaceae bacterium]